MRMYSPSLADRVADAPQLRRRRRLGRALARPLGRVEVIGVENLPADGPVVVAVNHRSALDGPLLFALLPRPVNFLVKVEAFTPTMTPVLRGAGQIPVTRQHVDRAAIRLCLEVLRAGGVIGIFPEGSRGDGLVGTAKPGVGYLALRSGATVVPVACHGTDAMTHRRSARRPLARIVIGPPVRVPHHPDGRPLNRRVVAERTEEIRGVLAGLVSDTVVAA